MDTIEWTVVGGIGLLIAGALVYAIVRLINVPRTGLDERSTRLARLLLYPRFFDPLLAKPMTRREKVGWFIVVALVITAIVFTTVTGLGGRR